MYQLFLKHVFSAHVVLCFILDALYAADDMRQCIDVKESLFDSLKSKLCL